MDKVNTYTNDDINNAQLRMIRTALDYANVNNASTVINASTDSTANTNSSIDNNQSTTSKQPLIDRILILYGMVNGSPDVYVEYISNGVVFTMSILYEIDNRINVSQERQSLTLSLLRSYVKQIFSASSITDNMTALVYSVRTNNLTARTVPGKPDGLWFDDYAHIILGKMI